MTAGVRWRRARAAGLVAALALTGGLTGCRNGPSASPGAFCASVATVPVVTSPEQLTGESGQATLEALEAALRRLRAKAPADVRSDVGTLASVTAELGVALRRVAADPADQATASAELDAPLAAWKAASERIVQYTDQTCGIQLGDR